MSYVVYAVLQSYEMHTSRSYLRSVLTKVYKNKNKNKILALMCKLFFQVICMHYTSKKAHSQETFYHKIAYVLSYFEHSLLISSSQNFPRKAFKILLEDPTPVQL